MPKQSYALKAGGPKRLEISWKGVWKNTTIQLDGNVIGVVDGQKELSAGREYLLPDGTGLKVQLVKKFLGVELQVLREGEPLPGSASDPETRIKTAYGIIFFVAGLNLVLGILAVALQVEFLQTLGLGFYSIIFGMAFLVAGFFVKRRSLAALVVAIVILALDGIVGIIGTIAMDLNPSVSGLVMRVFLLIPMIQGISGIRAVKKRVANGQDSQSI